MSKTNEEIEALKQSWVYDPIWDLEDTEGFEEYRGELKAFADLKRQQWHHQATQRRRTDAFNAPAFARGGFAMTPEDYDLGAEGLSKREYFAGLAMQGLIANGYTRGVLEAAVKTADDLIRALNPELFTEGQDAH